MGWDSSDVVIFDLANGGNELTRGGNDLVNSGNKLPSFKQFKSAYTSLIIGHRGYGYEANLQKIMCWEFSDVVIFDLANGGDDFTIGGNELPSGGNDLVSCGNELISGEEFSK